MKNQLRVDQAARTNGAVRPKVAVGLCDLPIPLDGAIEQSLTASAKRLARPLRRWVAVSDNCGVDVAACAETEFVEKITKPPRTYLSYIFCRILFKGAHDNA